MQSVRSNGSLPVALLMMMVGEDVVFCVNVMVLELGLYPIMCGLGCCWTNNVQTSVGCITFSLQNSKCAQHWSLPD
jgi:hypothetical protein